MIQRIFPTIITNPINTSETWTELNPILFKDEIGFESDTGYFKIGNGISTWNELPYSKSSIYYLVPGEGIEITDNRISANLYYEIIGGD